MNKKIDGKRVNYCLTHRRSNSEDIIAEYSVDPFIQIAIAFPGDEPSEEDQ